MCRWKPLPLPVPLENSVPELSEILFISDLHLHQSQPGITENFLNFIETRARRARVLYILGDLFEVWLGDDDPAQEYSRVLDALHHLSLSTELYFMHGNRDFLVGEQLARRVNLTLLEDPTVFQLGSAQVALMHGDLLCSDDVDYQNFRKLVRDPEWQQNFLAKPLTERQAIANALREKSGAEMQHKKNAIMDVNPQTVEQTMKNLNVDILIHGHTHRPGISQLAENKQRITLGDWHPEPSYLSWNNGEFTLVDSRVV